MRVRAIDLATRIAEAYAKTIVLEGETTARLATALHKGAGIIRQDHHCIVVLGSLLDPRFNGQPVCVADHLGKRQWKRPAIKASNIAYYFSQHCLELGSFKQRGARGKYWVPATQHSLAIIPIGGNLGEPVDQTASATSSTVYNWYDLREVPIGGIVYRLTSIRTLTVFQRLSQKHWGRFCISDATNMVDLGAVMSSLTGKDDQIDSLELDNKCSALTLIRQPPKLPNN